MDFLMQQELNGIRQDANHDAAKQEADKMAFEKKLLTGMGDEMKDLLEHPEKFEKYVTYAKKAQRKKRRNKLRENLKKIFGL